MGRSKARKLNQAHPVDIHVLHKKATDAVSRDAFQSAREWAKELFRREPNEQHRRLLVEATLGRAGELRRQGSAADAATILRSIVDAGFDSQEQTARAARELVFAGDWRSATPLVAKITDSAELERLNAARVDAAVLQGERGLGNLPPDLRPDTQRVLAALTALARGDDAAAVQDVAIFADDSPFFQWRLLVEGLAAFYSGQPALDCWQRMNADRAPAAMAAPFRAEEDKTFLNSQPARLQSDLTSAVQRLNSEPWISALNDVMRLVSERDVGSAIRRAGDVLKSMPAETPELRQRLARVMYWGVARHGSHQHFETYRRIFSPPHDDPNGHRLRAIQAENADDDWEAQEAWASYDEDLADGTIVAETDRNLARSLVWSRMGGLAESYHPTLPSPQIRSKILGGDLDEDDDDFEDDSDDARFPAIECYRRSVELAPKNLQSHESLIDLLNNRGQNELVVTESRRLLANFPDHEQALVALASDASGRQCWDEAVAYQDRAVRARPHDKFLTEQLDSYQLSLARQHAQQGSFDDARGILHQHLEKKKGEGRYPVLCRLAAVEMLAGQADRGDQLFHEACDVAPSRLAAIYRMLIESIRTPLDYGRTMRLESEFHEAVRAKPDAATVRELVTSVEAFHQDGTSYEGLQDHEKIILKYVKRAKRLKYGHADLIAISKSLVAFQGEKLALDFVQRGIKLFPADPNFPFLAGMYYLTLGPEKCPLPKMIRCLTDADKLAQLGTEHEELADNIRRMLKMAQTMSVLGRVQRMNNLIGQDTLMPSHLMNEIKNILGISLGDLDDDPEYDDRPDEEFVPRRPRR